MIASARLASTAPSPHLVFLLLLATSCASALPSPISPRAARVPEASAQLAPEERLVRTWFDAYAILSPAERRPWSRRGSILLSQAEAHRHDGQARELLESASSVLVELRLDRCIDSAEPIRAMTAPDPDAPAAQESRPTIYPLGPEEGLRTTRASRLAGLIVHVLDGLSSNAASCGVARIQNAYFWARTLEDLERRDGVAALLDRGDANAPQRAEVTRLQEIVDAVDGLMGSEGPPPLNPGTAALALRDEALTILERWAPNDARLVALRSVDAEALRSLDAQEPERDQGQRWRQLAESRSVEDPRLIEDRLDPLRETQALLLWAVEGISVERMPPQPDLSPEARAVRAFLDALRTDPAEAIRLAPTLPEPLPDFFDYLYDGGRDAELARHLAMLRERCQPSAAASSDDLAGDEESGYDDGVMLVERDSYRCSTELDGPMLLRYARAFDDQVDPHEWHSARYIYVNDPPRSPTALSLYARACDAGALGGCLRLALHRSSGPEEARDEARATSLLRRVCETEPTERFDEAHHAERYDGCARLAERLRHGLGVERDPSGALRYANQACEAQHPRGCRTMLAMALEREVSVDDEALFDEADRLCRMGSAEGCWVAGEALRSGRGVPRDLAEALPRFERGCTLVQPDTQTQGVLEACWATARIASRRAPLPAALELALAVACSSHEDSLACAWRGLLTDRPYERDHVEGCQRGEPDHCAVVGQICERRGERAAALGQYRASCDGGSSLGCYLLAERSVRRDPRRARDLYARACEDDDGMGLGCLELSRLLTTGPGVVRDLAEASAVRARFCAERHPEICAP